MKSVQTENKLVVDNLLEISAESANLLPAEVLNSFQCPDWEADRGWQWELYVDRDVRALWDGLSQDAKLIAFLFAVRRSREPSLLD